MRIYYPKRSGTGTYVTMKGRGVSSRVTMRLPSSVKAVQKPTKTVERIAEEKPAMDAMLNKLKNLQVKKKINFN